MKLQFPNPTSVSDKHGCVSRSAKDIIRLVNHEHGTDYKNLAPGVKRVVRDWARKLGWGAVFFPREFPTPSKFGIVVLVKHSELNKAVKHSQVPKGIRIVPAAELRKKLARA
jgi:hypothetical protein